MLTQLIVRALAALSLMACESSPILPNDYPARPITLVVPRSPGGGSNILGRVVAKELEGI